MKFPVAIQLYSLRNEMAKDVDATLAKVKEMGYDGVEFAGLYGLTPAQMKALCEKHGLTPISAHVPYVDVKANPDQLMADYAELGCKFIVIPYLLPEYRPGGELFDQVIADMSVFGKKAKEYGMQLCYHNHDFEFVKLDGEYALDKLFRLVDATLLQPQLDTCWVNVGGEVPTEYMHKYAGRMGILHLKDFVGSKAENMYALIGVDDKEKKEAPRKFEFRSVGSGVQNFPAILAEAQVCGVEWVVVEQDSPTPGKTPVECAKESITYLRSL